MQIIESAKNYVYRLASGSLSPTQLELYCKKKSIDFSWVVEAGCHDGSDTVVFSKMPNVARVFAFEPDYTARKKAKERFIDEKYSNIDLSELGLMNQSGYARIKYHAGEKGSGNSHIELSPLKESDDDILITTLDEFFSQTSPRSGQGLMWLDVEGAAVNVFEGAPASLKTFNLIKVEVEFRKMNEFRTGNYKQVIDILEKSGFVMVRGTIHPGLFGDLIFVRKGSGKNVYISQVTMKLLFLLLHDGIYRLKNKISRF